MIGGERGEVQVGGGRVIELNSLHIGVENGVLVAFEELDGKSGY